MSVEGSVETDIDTTYECKDCNTIFQDSSEFHQHDCCNSIQKQKKPRKNAAKPQKGGYTCEKCGNVYKQKRNLMQHMHVHNETFDFECTMCDKKFKSRTRLRCHFQTHEGRFSCPVCGKGFGESGNLKKHMRIHSGERPFKCETCEKTFTQKRHLQDHELTHSSELNHPCDLCGKRFLTKRSLKVHSLTHSKELPFGCPECPAAFTQQKSLRLHMFTHTTDRPFYCDYCGAGFKRHCDLKSHITLHTGEQPFTCELCQKPFHKLTLLKSHMLSHSEERPHQCNICGKSFKSMNVLKKHCFLHTGERAKQCYVCNKTFKCSNTLRTHYLTHSEDRPYSCEICGKSFKRITPLQNHLTMHTGELAFPCDICGKRFARKSTLENHFISHTGQKPYSCPKCDKSFTRKSSLKIHDAAVHTKEDAPFKFDNKDPRLIAGDMVRQAILASHNCISEEDEQNRKKFLLCGEKLPEENLNAESESGVKKIVSVNANEQTLDGESSGTDGSMIFEDKTEASCAPEIDNSDREKMPENNLNVESENCVKEIVSLSADEQTVDGSVTFEDKTEDRCTPEIDSSNNEEMPESNLNVNSENYVHEIVSLNANEQTVDGSVTFEDKIGDLSTPETDGSNNEEMPERNLNVKSENYVHEIVSLNASEQIVDQSVTFQYKTEDVCTPAIDSNDRQHSPFNDNLESSSSSLK